MEAEFSPEQYDAHKTRTWDLPDDPGTFVLFLEEAYGEATVDTFQAFLLLPAAQAMPDDLYEAVRGLVTANAT
jgi:hypothetical protein